jgi:hypothetical protein
MVQEVIKAARFKGHSDKSGKDYTYYRILVKDHSGKYWVSDFLFPNFSPSDADGNPIRPDLDSDVSGFDGAGSDLPPLGV